MNESFNFDTKTTLNMLERRGINLARYKRREISVTEDIYGGESISDILSEIREECRKAHCEPPSYDDVIVDYCQIPPHMEEEVYYKYRRMENDEEFARRIIAEYDENSE